MTTDLTNQERVAHLEEMISDVLNASDPCDPTAESTWEELMRRWGEYKKKFS